MRLCRQCGAEKPVEDFRHAHRWCHTCKECHATYGRVAKAKLRKRVLEHYGGVPPKCACCGESTQEFLQMNHINGGGGAHRKEEEVHNKGLYRWLLDHGYPDGFNVLCANCNYATYLHGTCPHKKVVTNVVRILDKDYPC
jgi:hypothetical protein